MINLLRCRFFTGSSSIKSSVDGYHRSPHRIELYRSNRSLQLAKMNQDAGLLYIHSDSDIITDWY